MKKLLSTLLVVVFLLTSLGLTSLAADDYSVQYLGDGFARINLTNQVFAPDTARTFTVNIAEDGEYAIFISNPNITNSRVTATFAKDGKTIYASNRLRTGGAIYERLGVPTDSGSASSVSLTKGEWTLSINAIDGITIPYIDVRSTVISVDGTKQAIYPMDVNYAATTFTFGATINLSGNRYAKAPADFTYYGNLENPLLAELKTAHGALRLYKGVSATYKINAKYPGEYKITGYGNFRTNSTNVNKDADETETINMTVGSNEVAVGSFTFTKGYYGWGDFVSVETTVNLSAGETSIVFENPNTDGIMADWYLDYILVEGINIEEPEEPDVPVDPENPEEPGVSGGDFPLNRTSSYLTIGMTAQLTTDETVTWSTSDKTVATVSADGLVTAVALGEAYISATTSDGKTSLCKVTVYDNNVREHQSVPTPDINGGSFLTDLFGKENFKLMLTFDDNAEDVTGNVNTTVFDTLTYDKGFNGKAANFTNGYVELTDAVLGDKSITISTWVKTNAITDRSFVISTTPFNTGTNNYSGFYTVLEPNAMGIFYTRKDGNDPFRSSKTVAIGTEAPSDIYDGWVNLTWVFDKETAQFYTYVDYELVQETNLRTNGVWDGEWKPLIGRGKTSNGYVYKYDGLMDDFFIYNGAMTAEDLQQIKGYYKVGKAVPVEDISLNTKELLLAINETSTIPTTITPADATIQNLVWTSSNSSVATVDARGKVRGISKGSAQITATTLDGGFTDSCLVTVSDSIAPFEYDRVCIIGIDGAGAWLDDNFMPNVQRIFSPYATTNVNQTTLPSVSATNWGSMLHGVGYEHHRLNNYTGGYFTYPIDSPYPSVFRVLREADPDAIMASFASYGTINRGLIEDGLGVIKGGGTDDEVHAKVLDYISANDPKLMFAYYGDVDHTGHTYGYGPQIPEYVEAMSKCDGFIADIYEAYETKGYLDTTLFILCTDHGGTGTYHGGNTSTEMNTFLGLCGPGVRQNSTMGESYTYDVAAITAHALGLERPDNWTGKVPDGAFIGVVGDTRNEVPLPDLGYRDHINTSTPKAEGTHLTDIFGKENFAALLEFDDSSAKDTAGKNGTTINNTLTYEEGYFGRGADFSNGSVTLDGTTLGQNSFTVGMWMKTDSLTGSPLLMSSKEYDSITGDGFYAVLDNSIADNTIMKLHFREGTKRADLGDTYLYKDYKDGWTHILFVFDREKGYMTSYVDFKITNGDVLQNTDMLIASNPLTIGSDGDGNHADPLTATLDDVFLYNGAMTADDIAKLQAYYSKEGTEIKLTDVKFEDTVSFDYTLNGDKTDATIYAAVYDEYMKLIDVKKLPALLGGYGIENASDAKYLKAFVIDSNFVPKSVPASATKN